MLTRLRTRIDDTRDAGMTLAELLVGMTLVSIISAISLSFFIGMVSQSSRTTNQSLNAADVRAAMNQVVTLLRLADSPTSQPGYSTSRFLTIQSSHAVFFSNLADRSQTASTNRTPPMMIDLSVTNGKLVEKSFAPIHAYTTYPSGYDFTTNYPATPTSTSILLNGLSSTSVFAYCTDATDPSTTCTAATTGDQVSSVNVMLSVKGLTGQNTQALQSGVAITGAVT